MSQLRKSLKQSIRYDGTQKTLDYVLPFEYYHLVFDELIGKFNRELSDAYKEPQKYRRDYTRNQRERSMQKTEAWDFLYKYLTDIEERMKCIIDKHTLFYWMHLYRRVGVVLPQDLENKTDDKTLYLVRNILETAFTKYGQIEILFDAAKATSVTVEEILGGLFREVHVRHFKKAQCDFYFNSILNSPNYVLILFSEQDFINVFRLEAMSYEYWLTSARLRAIGKGSTIVITGRGDIVSQRSDELDELMISYDKRIESRRFDVSMLGVGFYEKQHTGPSAVVARYNLEQIPFSIACPFREAVEKVDMISNFIFSQIELGAYLENHKFIDEIFRSARGFSLTSYVGYLSAITWLEFGQVNLKTLDSHRINFLRQLYQRAYTVTNASTYFVVLRQTATELMDHWFGKGCHDFSKDAHAIRRYLTIDLSKRGTPGLWSGGPRYVFAQYGEMLTVDISSIVIILEKAFFRIKHNQIIKGKVYENAFRKLLESQSDLSLLPERSLTNSQGTREVDAAVRKGNILFLCECRAMERPLDYEIGRLKTIEYRNTEFAEKLVQVDSLKEFIEKNPLGNNYDYRWANRIISFVVSPFVEWIWSLDKNMWLNKSVPRILSSEEAVTYMNREF